MSSISLSETSFAVLGLVRLCGEATPYQLKQVAQASILHFWSIPHTQIYTECARLAEAGLLRERREEGGRRRRAYSLSEVGSEALDEWRADPHTDLYELRDPGLLKLFCGTDPEPLAAAQLDLHRQRLDVYERIAAQEGLPPGTRLALESGIGHEREYLRFWSAVAAGETGH
jgi:DNA-binding PadR family transcriptional regulator